MKFIVITGPLGIRKVAEVPGKGASFTLGPGERVTGSESDDPPDRTVYILDKLAGYFGIAVADLILYGAKAFNIEPCSRCEMRYKILKAITEIGLVKATRLLYKTIRGVELTEAETEQVLSQVKLAGLDKSNQ